MIEGVKRPIKVVDIIGRESMCEVVDVQSGRCLCEQGSSESARGRLKDDVRKFISFDLSYSIYDRIIQTKRMLGFAEIFIKNRLFPIISTVYLNKKVYLNAKKIGILVVKVEREKNKTNLKLKNKKNVVGIDITLPKFKCLVIKNISEKSKKKFFEQIKKIITF